MILCAKPTVELLTPLGQFGIAVRGGINLVLHSTRILLERCLQPHKETRAMLLLDLESMSKEASQQATRDKLLAHPQLCLMVPFFDLLCAEDLHCFFMDDSHTM